MRLSSRRVHQAGFALIEALGALAIAGAVLSALLVVTSQWLPAWKRGMDRVQRAEMIAAAMRRVGDDFAAAQFVPANREQKAPLFIGQEFSAMFVRGELGPNAGHGLDIISIGEDGARNERVVRRSRAPFEPVPVGQSARDRFRLRDSVMLLPAPFRLSFAYADRSMAWTTEWRDSSKLPFAVRIAVRDESRGGQPVLVSAVQIAVDAPGGGSVDGIAAGAANAAPAAAQPQQAPKIEPVD